MSDQPTTGRVPREQRGSTLADRMDGDYPVPILRAPVGGPIPGSQPTDEDQDVNE